MVASAILLGVALVIGLIQVGDGFALRGSSTGLTVTGESEANVSANQVVWTLTAQELSLIHI